MSALISTVYWEYIARFRKSDTYKKDVDTAESESCGMKTDQFSSFFPKP